MQDEAALVGKIKNLDQLARPLTEPLASLEQLIRSLSLTPEATHALIERLEPIVIPPPTTQKDLPLANKDVPAEHASQKLDVIKSPPFEVRLYPWADNDYGYSVPLPNALGPFYCVTRGKRVGVFSSW
jgi:hypothetical protein